MGFFDKVTEPFRDKKRDDMCARLRSLGIDAQMAERNRTEEKISGSGKRSLGLPGMRSLGLIDIAEGPIRWVNVLPSVRKSPLSPTEYYTDYGVPDPRLGPRVGRNIPSLKIKSVCKTSGPVFGQVIDLQWEGRDFGLGIVGRLNSDISIKRPIMKSGDVTIRAYSTCWIMTMVCTQPLPEEPLSKELWNCYQAIAWHLLADWPPA